MNAPIKFFAPIGLAVLALIFYASAFIVNQWEVAIKLRLGEIVDSDYKPGLHFMIPVINNVKKFDGRLQTLESRPQRFLTVEKKDVIVDSYAKWRITNPGQFFRSTGGDSARTSRLLAERINTGLRDEFGRRTIQEVVSEDRYQLMDELTKAVDRQAAELGIEVVDVRVKKIDLPPEVSESVYERMRAERERVARDLRAKGSEAAERIRADADRQRTVILADAYKLAEEARGEGDARAAEIYATAYNQDQDFYAFYRSLNAYRAAFGQGNDMLVLQPDSDFFRFFNQTTRSPVPTVEVTLPMAVVTPPAAVPVVTHDQAVLPKPAAPASALNPGQATAPATAPAPVLNPETTPALKPVLIPEPVRAPTPAPALNPEPATAPTPALNPESATAPTAASSGAATAMAPPVPAADPAPAPAAASAQAPALVPVPVPVPVSESVPPIPPLSPPASPASPSPASPSPAQP